MSYSSQSKYLHRLKQKMRSYESFYKISIIRLFQLRTLNNKINRLPEIAIRLVHRKKNSLSFEGLYLKRRNNSEYPPKKYTNINNRNL